MIPRAADKEMQSYLVRLQGLDATRSKRMYIALTSLSEKAVEALKNKDMKSFSAYTDDEDQQTNDLLDALEAQTTPSKDIAFLDEELAMDESQPLMNA